MDFQPISGEGLDTVYIKGAGPDFAIFIQSKGDKAQIVTIGGHARWIVTRDDGTKYIARPEEADPNK